jgi:hypothetical protein
VNRLLATQPFEIRPERIALEQLRMAGIEFVERKCVSPVPRSLRCGLARNIACTVHWRFPELAVVSMRLFGRLHSDTFPQASGGLVVV